MGKATWTLGRLNKARRNLAGGRATHPHPESAAPGHLAGCARRELPPSVLCRPQAPLLRELLPPECGLLEQQNKRSGSSVGVPHLWGCLG